MNARNLTPEEIKSFEEFYDRRLLEVGGARSYDDDAEIVREMLRAVREDGMTPTADGGVSFVRRDGMDWTDPNAVEAARSATGGRRGAPTGGAGDGNPKDMLMGVAVLVALVGGMIWWFGFRGNSEAVAADEPVEETAVAGAEAFVMPTPVPTLESDLLADIVDEGVKTGLVTPRTLEIKGVSFVVQAVKITSGDWPFPDDPRAVSWVYGTVVNYVMGVEATDGNKTLLASLGAGDELLLRMSTGPAYRFAYVDAVRVSPQASEVFRQNRPGLTLALMGEKEQSTRIIIRAVYLPESELGATAPERGPVASGQVVPLGDELTVTVVDRYPLSADTPVGYASLAVDYRLENTGVRPLASAAFQHRLEAEGMTYAAAPGVGGGAYPSLPPSIEPGRVVTATAVYAVPEAVLRAGSVWIFSPDMGGVLTVRVSLPPRIGAISPEVGIREVTHNEEDLMVTFDIHAPMQSLTVQAGDIQLSGGALNPVQSQFPWHLEGGERGTFSLSLRPVGSVTQIALLGQAFELKIEN